MHGLPQGLSRAIKMIVEPTWDNIAYAKNLKEAADLIGDEIRSLKGVKAPFIDEIEPAEGMSKFYNTLKHYGITRFSQLVDKTEKELMNKPGIGRQCMSALKDHMLERDLWFKE